MKTAVVFYSLEGNCTLVAQEIQTLTNADLVQIQLRNEKKRTGFAKFFWGGGMAFFHIKPALKPYRFDPATYDLIILGTPVWAGFPAPPILSFLSQTKISGKKLVLFACHAGGMKDALEKLKIKLKGNDIVSENNFIYPVRQDPNELKQKIANWVKGFCL